MWVWVGIGLVFVNVSGMVMRAVGVDTDGMDATVSKVATVVTKVSHTLPLRFFHVDKKPAHDRIIE